MTVYIENVRLVFPGNESNGQRISLLIQNGKIKEINPKKEPNAKHHINGKNLVLFPGLVDAQCHSGEPGFEDKETFESLKNAAKKGGFTDLIILPGNDPVTDSRSEVKYIQEASDEDVQLHAFGSITKELQGDELSEMFDMHRTGAVAFTDGKTPVEDVNMMKRALDYAKNFDGIVLSFPHDGRVAPGGMVNEGSESMLLGLKSTPALAEELMLNRDLYLNEYCGSRIHVASITTKGSVDLIKKHKGKENRVSCGVPLANLLFTEKDLKTFDTNYKLSPPLRGEQDRKALIKAVKNGIIDVVVSDHTPETIERKDVEFEQSAYGITMLETALAAYQTHLSEDIELEQFVQTMSLNPRRVFGLEMPALAVGEPFRFTLFDPKHRWKYDQGERASKSVNSPFLNQELIGKVIEL